jgi:hypothetical protein
VSPDGLVRLQVNPGGALISLEISQSAERIPMARLAGIILQTYGQATSVAAARTVEIMSELTGPNSDSLEFLKSTLPQPADAGELEAPTPPPGPGPGQPPRSPKRSRIRRTRSSTASTGRRTRRLPRHPRRNVSSPSPSAPRRPTTTSAPPTGGRDGRRRLRGRTR